MTDDTLSLSSEAKTENTVTLEATPPPKKKMGRPVTRKDQYYLSMRQACQNTGISISHMKVIKLLYPEAFKCNNVNSTKVEAWYKANQDKVLAQAEQGIDTLRKQKIQNEIELQKLLIAEKRGQVVEFEELETFLQKLGLGVSNVLLGKLVTELPDRINRVDSSVRITMCKQIYNEIVAKLKNEIDSWLKNRKNHGQ